MTSSPAPERQRHQQPQQPLLEARLDRWRHAHRRQDELRPTDRPPTRWIPAPRHTGRRSGRRRETWWRMIWNRYRARRRHRRRRRSRYIVNDSFVARHFGSFITLLRFRTNERECRKCTDCAFSTIRLRDAVELIRCIVSHFPVLRFKLSRFHRQRGNDYSDRMTSLSSDTF